MVQDTGNRLITAFQKQTERIVYFCLSENISPNLSVHEIRKSFKRMRALLRFYAEIPSNYSEKFIAEIKAAGKVLSPIRESHVNSQLFERFAGNESHFPERKIKQVRDILNEKNRLLIENDFFRNNLPGEITRFARDFEQVHEKLAANQPTMLQMEVQLAKSFAESSEIYRTPDPGFQDGNLHELRKSLKNFLYQLDFIKYMHLRYFRLKIYHLNRITEHLGEDHDLCVFLNELKLAEYKLTGEELSILENQVAHQREINMLKLSPRLKQFFNEPPEMFSHRLERIFRII